MAYRLALLGQTDKQMAAFFGVSEQTLNTWKHKHPKFLESLKRGKIEADADVVESLFKRATGFTKKAVKIMQADGKSFEHVYDEYYPPEVGAIVFWLKNRQKEQFRDKPDVNVTVNNEHGITVDLNKPPEQWGEAEIKAALAKSGGLEEITGRVNGNGHTAKEGKR